MRKGVYPYMYINSWQRFSETLLPDKKDFYSSLIMKDSIEADSKHWKRVWEDFNIQYLRQNHDLSVQSETLLLAAVFRMQRNIRAGSAYLMSEP